MLGRSLGVPQYAPEKNGRYSGRTVLESVDRSLDKLYVRALFTLPCIIAEGHLYRTHQRLSR